VATLEVTRSQETLTSGNKPVVSYVLRNCLVTSVTPAISGNEISEEVCLSFEEIEWGYRSVLADGSFGELISRRFSFAQNRQLMHIVEEGGVLPAGGPLTPQPPPRLGYHEFVPMTAFIVMWMDPEHPELVDIHNVIRETCDAYGIRAVRADDIQHDDKITDLILEQIRTSEFIVADLTGERPNVYYEIGHAHASGKRPILVRRKGTHLHFDLSTHNVKEYRNATELREILHRRFDGLGLKRNRSEI
jgi:hypothetical protein